MVGSGGGVSEEFAKRRRYDNENNEADVERAVIRSTMNAAKTKTSHIITAKKPPEKEHRRSAQGEQGDQLKLDGFVDKLKQYADRNSGMFKKSSQVNTALEEIKQRISGPLSTAYEDDYGAFFNDDVTELGFELVVDEEEPEWAAFEEPEDRVEVVNLVFAPEAVEDSDGTPIKIFPASELEKLKVTWAKKALSLE